MQYYVGEDTIDSAANIQEICQRIGELKQEQRNNKGVVTVDTPDVLFDKFLQLASCLPDDATSWPITLCSVFQQNLSQDLLHRMIEDKDFKMPTLQGQLTKRLQLEALQQGRQYATTCYNSLLEQRR